MLNEGIRFQEGLANSNDVLFVATSLMSAKHISWVDECLIHYRIGDGSSTQDRKSEYPLCFLEAFEAVLAEARKRNLAEKLDAALANFFMSHFSFNLKTIFKSVYFEVLEAVWHSEIARCGYIPRDLGTYLDSDSAEYVQGSRFALECYLRERQIAGLSESQYSVAIDERKALPVPSVSVVMPVYNTEAYVAEAVGSVLSQTLQNIELICVNDGSTDGSLPILLGLAAQDSRMIVVSGPNCCQSVARNAGFAYVRGEYTYYFDSDDLLCPNTLEVLVARMDAENLDLLCFDGESFSDDEGCDEALQRYAGYYCSKGKHGGIYSGPDLLLSLMDSNDFRASVSLKLFRRQLLAQNDLRFVPGRVHEDEAFSFEALFLAKRAVHHPVPLFRRRLRPNSIMTSEASFPKALGLFCTVLDLMRFKVSRCSADQESQLIVDRGREVLSSARWAYRDLSVAERGFWRGLSGEKSSLYEELIVDPVNRVEYVVIIEAQLKYQEKRIAKLDQRLEMLETKLSKSKARNDRLTERVADLKAVNKELKAQRSVFLKVREKGVGGTLKSVFRKIKKLARGK